jgi:hypothetical protein
LNRNNISAAILVAIGLWWTVVVSSEHWSFNSRILAIAVSTFAVYLITSFGRSGNAFWARNLTAGILVSLFVVVLLTTFNLVPYPINRLALFLGLVVLLIQNRNSFSKFALGGFAIALSGAFIFQLGMSDLLPYGKAAGWCLFATGAVVVISHLGIRITSRR